MKTSFIRKNIPKWLTRPYILSSRPELLLSGFSFIVLLIILLIARHYDTLECIGKDIFQSDESRAFIAESLKILGAAIFAGFVALLVTNTWQQKSIGFEMLKELNSPEFFEVRNVLSTQKKIAQKENIDIEDVSSWFPRGTSNLEKDIVLYKKEEFGRIHALPSMIYFVVRLSNYARSGMLNIRVTKPLYNVFFVHYRIVLLEFARAFEEYYMNTYRHNPQSSIEVENRMWLRRIEDIKFFFYMIGIDGDLPIDHVYKYFPSLNPGYENKQPLLCASDIDLNDYLTHKKREK